LRAGITGTYRAVVQQKGSLQHHSAPAFFVSASQRRIASHRIVRLDCQHHPASAPQQGQADATLQQYLNECTFATTARCTGVSFAPVQA